MKTYADLMMEQATRIQKLSKDVGFITLSARDYGPGIGVKEIDWRIWDGEEGTVLTGGSLAKLSDHIDKLIFRRNLLLRKF